MRVRTQDSRCGTPGDAGSAGGTIACRRCGGAFTRPGGAAARMLLASCPHCGAAVRPLRLLARTNANAAVVALVALGVLTAGVLLPFVSMSHFGTERTFSLIGGIVELFERGNALLGMILLVFSVIFPYAKLLALLVATSGLAGLRPKNRRRLAHVAHLTGRYSLLDLLVVAVMIVVIKFESLVEIRALPGTGLFAAAVFLSMLAGMLVNLSGTEGEMDG